MAHAVRMGFSSASTCRGVCKHSLFLEVAVLIQCTNPGCGVVTARSTYLL